VKPRSFTEPTADGERSSVWKRNLVVLSVGQVVTISAMGIVIPLIPFFLRELGMTDRAALERWSGLVFAGPFLAAASMSPVWGFLGDRYGHKKMVVRAIVALAVVRRPRPSARFPARWGSSLPPPRPAVCWDPRSAGSWPGCSPFDSCFWSSV
jgi:hypothetical protein